MAGIKGKSGGARQNSGGVRAGAGRKQGTKNPRTIAAMEAARLLPYADDPKQWLLALMCDPRQDLRRRVDTARALMPYLHARPG
jgi:hypothetical protein